jgi:uncharacterized protein (DUF983 family)
MGIPIPKAAIVVQFPVPSVDVVVVTLVGQIIVGRILSVMVTVKMQVAELLAASVTVYLTVVTPTLNVYVPT